MPHVLITGGSGFFGGVLKRRLLSEGFSCINIDLVPDTDTHPNLISVRGDIRDSNLLTKLFRDHPVSSVMHTAALLAHDSINEKDVWGSNVDGTRSLAHTCQESGVRKLVFISTNCLWASNLGHPVSEDEPPAPIEVYGRSKLAAEQLLHEYTGFQTIVLRCPTIIDSGRLGLLAILFEFIAEGKKIWVVGDGENRYQFVYAQDLATACILGMKYNGSGTFNVGSDNVQPLRSVYQAVIDSAKSRSRIASLPKSATIAAMKLAHTLNLSPLGPYHYRMIAEDFTFDTTRIQQTLGWRPTLTNEEMLVRAYHYYAQNRQEINARKDVSAHSKPSSMGVIRLLKWIS